MATNYPGSLDSGTQQPSPSSSTEMDDSGFEHDVVHTNHSGAIIALETKVGTGDSNAVANSVLAGTGSGTSAWTTGTLANDISGNAATATALETARTIDITGDITATAVAFDGTANIAISAAVNNDSHTHDTRYYTESESDAKYLLNTTDTLSGSLTVTADIFAQDELYVGTNGGGDSPVHFYDDNSNTWRTLMWDDSANSFDFEDRINVKGNGGAILTLQDTGGTDTGGYVSFTQSGGTRMGFVGYANNDDLYMKNENSGGNLYFGVQAGYAFQVDTSRNLVPYNDNTQSLGKSGRAWNHFYLHQGNTFSSGGYWTLRSRDSDRQVMEYVSSERFKKDIVDLSTEEAYQILDARPIKFRGIDDDDTVPLEAGLSAESLHEAGFEYAVRYDEGHWGETPRSVYYDMLTAPLIKICQDLHARLAALEAA